MYCSLVTELSICVGYSKVKINLPSTVPSLQIIDAKGDIQSV